MDVLALICVGDALTFELPDYPPDITPIVGETFAPDGTRYFVCHCDLDTIAHNLPCGDDSIDFCIPVAYVKALRSARLIDHYPLR